MNEQKKRLKTIFLSFKGNQREFGNTIGKSKQTISGWLRAGLKTACTFEL
ncbi:hypothetical protein LEP1GSC163_0094 [Leptospira santarosai str. CBC379]|nr:hypothetical protein LEP1GSC163_0094 [Leptospira santarosai str. CBC379]